MDMDRTDILRRSTIYAYASISLPLAVIGYPLAVYLPPFYAQEIGISMAMVGLMLLIARITDVITDPLIGRLSDRWQTGFGRRKPWLVLGTVLMIVAAFQVFMPAKGAGAIYLLVWTSILYLGWTMVMIPHHAWGAELSEFYHERSRVTAAREIYILCGLLLAGIVPAFIQGMGARFEAGKAQGPFMQFLIRLLGEEGTLGTGLAPILSAIAWMMIILLPLAVLWAVFGVKETTPRAAGRIDWKKGMAILKKNSPFQLMMLMLVVVVAAESFRSALSVFFMQYVIDIQAKIGLMYLIYFVAGILGIPVWLFLGKKIGKHRALCAAALISGLAIASMYFLDAGHLKLFAVLFAIKGFCFGAYQLLLSSMLADIVDLDIAQSGEQRTGLFFAFSGMATKMAMAAGVGVSLGLLSLAGFNAAVGIHTPRQIMALKILYIGGPLLLYLTVFFLARKYPLTSRHHNKLRRIITRRNARAGQEM
jgi:Na+/melibiose symporter-like transporter